MDDLIIPNIFNNSLNSKSNQELLFNIIKKNKINSNIQIPKNEELKISAKTTLCVLENKINLVNLCEYVDFILENKNKISSTGKRKVSKTNIVYIKYNKNKKGEIETKNSKDNDNFFNAIIIKIQIREDKIICLMIFKNGTITCTGCKKNDDGLTAVKMLFDEIKNKNDIILLGENDKIKIKEYRTVMMNGNFHIGFLINNDKLFKYLLEHREKYNLFIDYDPETYQGVKIYYMWNENQSEKNGVCVCKKKCKYSVKKKKGDGENNCRRISIAVFSTGKILISGSISDEQMNDAFNFILKLLRSIYSEIVQYSILVEEKKCKKGRHIDGKITKIYE